MIFGIENSGSGLEHVYVTNRCIILFYSICRFRKR